MDEGSNPSSSTLNDKKLLIVQRLFFILNLFSLRKRQQKNIHNNFFVSSHTRKIVSSYKKDYSFEHKKDYSFAHKKDFIFEHTNKKG